MCLFDSVGLNELLVCMTDGAKICFTHIYVLQFYAFNRQISMSTHIEKDSVFSFVIID